MFRKTNYLNIYFLSFFKSKKISWRTYICTSRATGHWPCFQPYVTVQTILSAAVVFTKHNVLNVNDKFKFKKIHTLIQSSKTYVLDELHSADCIVKMLNMQSAAEAKIPCKMWHFFTSSTVALLPPNINPRMR